MNQNGNDITALRRMLREIADLAENASLTGALSGGAHRAVQRYNAVLRQLVEMGATPAGIFEELNVETTDFGQLGVDARLLGSSLKGKESENGGSQGDSSVLVRLAPFIRGEDLAVLIKQHLANGAHISARVITALAPFMRSEDLGELVREHLMAETQSPSSPPSPPTPPPPPSSPEKETLEDLARQLSSPELSREDRARIAARLAELANGG